LCDQLSWCQVARWFIVLIANGYQDVVKRCCPSYLECPIAVCGKIIDTILQNEGCATISWANKSTQRCSVTAAIVAADRRPAHWRSRPPRSLDDVELCYGSDT